MNNKNVWQHNKLVPMDKKNISECVFKQSKCEFSTPGGGGGGKNPKKGGSRERKEAGVG